MKQEENSLYKTENIRVADYSHGGARVYFEDEKGKRQLIIDFYGDKEDEFMMRLKKVLIKTIHDMVYRIPV
jgi:hypothetical protein